MYLFLQKIEYSYGYINNDQMSLATNDQNKVDAEELDLFEESLYIKNREFADVSFFDIMEAEELEELRFDVFSTLKQLIFTKMLCMRSLAFALRRLDAETISNARFVIDFIVESIEDNQALHYDQNHWTQVLSVYDHHCALDFENRMLEEIERLGELFKVIENLEDVAWTESSYALYLGIDDRLIYELERGEQINVDGEIAEKVTDLMKWKFLCLRSYCVVLDTMRIEETSDLYYDFPELISFEDHMFVDGKFYEEQSEDSYERFNNSVFLGSFQLFNQIHDCKKLFEKLSDIAGQ